jgi:hypothetical protein
MTVSNVLWEWHCEICGGHGMTGRPEPQCFLCGEFWKGKYRQIFFDQIGNNNVYGEWQTMEVNMRLASVASALVCGITTFNRPDWLRLCLMNYVRNCTIPTQFIIYQDGSDRPIPTEEISISSPHSLLRNIIAKENRGIAHGRAQCVNTFLTRTSVDLFLNLDDDALVKRNGIELLTRVIRSNPRFGLVGASNFFREVPAGVVAYARVAGFCWLVERQVFEKIGNFDAKAFLKEDHEFYLRAWMNGYTPVCTKANVAHKREPRGVGHRQHNLSKEKTQCAQYIQERYRGWVKIASDNSIRWTPELRKKRPDHHFRLTEKELIQVAGRPSI